MVQSERVKEEIDQASVTIVVVLHFDLFRSHLRKTDSALLGGHVASPSVNLRQLGDVVVPVLFRFTFRKVCASKSKKEEATGGLMRCLSKTEFRNIYVKKKKKNPHFIRSSLMSSNLLMLGNFSCISFLTPRLIPTGTTFRLLQVAKPDDKND